MKKLSDSQVFSKSVMNNELISRMKLITSNNGLEMIRPADLPNAFNSIDRRINYSTKGPILDRINKGKIVMIDDEATKMPSYLNSVPGKGVNGGVVIYVNLVRYKTKSGDIYPKTLFAILQNALILQEFMTNWTKYTNNLELVKESSFIYSRITTKVLDKVFALDLDNFNSDLLSFLFAKFFLVNMCERTDNDLNDQLAYRSCFNKSSFELIKETEKGMNPNKFNSIFDLIESVKEISALKNINVRTFTENFVRMYGEGSLLLLDYLPSFYQCIFSSAIGGNLVRDYMYESVAGKSILKAYATFSKIVS